MSNENSGETMRTIDLTPTWAGILPGLLEVIAHGETIAAVNLATTELERMARLADAYVKQYRATNPYASATGGAPEEATR